MGNCGYSRPAVTYTLIFVQRVIAPINFYSISIYSAPIEKEFKKHLETTESSTRGPPGGGGTSQWRQLLALPALRVRLLFHRQEEEEEEREAGSATIF